MRRWMGAWLATAIVLAALGSAGRARALDETPVGFERTPPRLSYSDGEVSFWRPGATDWAPARVNTPLAESDELYTGAGANLELQVGQRAYVRAGENTQLGLSNLEPDYLQFRVTSGTASFDLRNVPAGHTIEVDTPNAAFTIEHPGYYRVEITDDGTTFISRRGGRATVTAAKGQSAAIEPSEEAVVSGTDSPTVETYAAPELDDWDRWNYTRTDQQIDALSTRYVPSAVYGVDDLDHYGSWRVVPTYGAIWVPRVAVGWAPYSVGSWIYDPFYGWTWVSDEPWGWAPYHYGRWVSVGGYWGWAPGPIVVRPYYAPALVAFYGSPGFSIGIGFGAPYFGWVALGWGEPLIPWWGPHGCRGVPHWAGWGGPRLVNNVVIQRNTFVNVNQIHGYANAAHAGGIVAIDRSDFGRRNVREARLARFDASKLRPVGAGELGVKPAPASMVGTERRAALRPPRTDLERSVVAERKPAARAIPELDRSARRGAQRAPAGDLPQAQAPARLVGPETPQRNRVVSERPPFGTRSTAERSVPAPPPRFEELRQQRTQERAARGVAPAPPRGEREPTVAPSAPAVPEAGVGRRNGRIEGPTRGAAPQRPIQAAPRQLPGEPAGRVFRGRGGAGPSEVAPRSAPSRSIERAPAPRGGGGASGGSGGGGGTRGGGGGAARGGGGGRSQAGHFR